MYRGTYRIVCTISRIVSYRGLDVSFQPYFMVCACHLCRDHFVYGPSQWETTLHNNVISHWLGTYTKWSLSVGWFVLETRWVNGMLASEFIPVTISYIWFVSNASCLIDKFVFVLWQLAHPFLTFGLLTLKHQETHGCVVSTVATDALVLKHQAISILSTD